MVKTYISRQETLANCPPVELWPTVKIDLIAEAHQELFSRRCEAVKKYIDGYPTSEIEDITGVAKNSISRLVRNCLALALDGRIAGFRALIPFNGLRNYERKSKVNPKYPESQGGMSGLFSNTLKKFPDIEKRLIQYIKKTNSAQINVHEKKIRAKDLHKLFIKLLKEHGVENHEWPFNTKHIGFKTIQKYLNGVLDESFGRTVNTREEQVASAHLAVGTGHQAFLSFEEPFDVVQLDAYSINAFFTSEFETPEGTSVDVQLERIWHIAMIEPVSGAILAYKTVYRSEVSADDVMDVIRRAVNHSIRVELTIPGLRYPENGGMPDEIFDQCKGAVWGAIMLDGALAHLSSAIHDRARKQLGFVINWGPVAHFERRPDIERYFAKLSLDVFMRFPSTTGSNPHNGRAKKAEEKAITYKIRADEVEQIVAVITAQHNATPSQGTSFNSPIEVLDFYITKNANHFLLRKIPLKTGTNIILMPMVRNCTVRGGSKSGRRPYIQILGERYTSAVLANTAGLIGKTLTVEIDDNDARYCHAYLPNGSELGILRALGTWGKTKHSIRTRKIINSLISKKILVVANQQDPVQVYLDYLSTRNKAKKKTIINPSSASEATRIAIESGLPKKIVNQSNLQNTQLPKLGDLYEKRPTLLNKPMPDLNRIIKNK